MTQEYEDQPLSQEELDEELHLLISMFLSTSSYGKLQFMLKEGLLTPSSFKALKIFKDPGWLDHLLDVKWLLEYIYPNLVGSQHSEVEKYDRDFIIFLVVHHGSSKFHKSKRTMFDQALDYGLDPSKIPSIVWIRLFECQAYRSDEVVIIKRLFELDIPFPEEEFVEARYFNDHELRWSYKKVRPHRYILKKLFDKPELFKLALNRLPGVTLGKSTHNRDIINSLDSHAEEANLEHLFQTGFSAEQLRESHLFEAIVVRGSNLIDDWIRRNLGVPSHSGYNGAGGCLMLTTSGTMSNRYSRKVAIYLMEKKAKHMIDQQCIQSSITLIKCSIRLDFITRDEWEDVITHKDTTQEMADNIRYALSSKQVHSDI
jgi:hypothetical protein